MKRSADELEEDHRKTFYFIEPKPCKVKATPFVPLNGDKEPIDDVKERYRVYSSCMNRILTTVDSLIKQSNNSVFEDLARFIELKSKKQTAKSSLITSTQRMPVAYVSLTSNTANNYRILNEFYNMAKKDTVQLVSINHKSGSSTMKAITRDMEKSFANQVDLGSSSKGKQLYNLDLIKQWYQKHPDDQLIIVFEETDSIDPEVFNKVLKNVHSNLGMFHVKIVLGVSATNITEWIEEHIFHEYRLLLDHYKFQTSNNKQEFFKVLEEIVINQGLLFDDISMSIVLNRFYNNNRSIDALINELKILLMVYFYSNSYSRLLFSPVSLKDVTILRRLPSFKRHIEVQLHKHKFGHDTTGEFKEEIQALIQDDKKVVEMFNEVKSKFHKFQHLMKEISRSVQTEEKFKLYSAIIQGNWKDPKLAGHLDKLEALKQLDFNKKMIFHEAFLISIGSTSDPDTTLAENYSNLMLDLLRPQVRGRLGDSLISSESYLDLSKKSSNDVSVEPLITKLFTLLTEAPTTLNHYEFYMAFKFSIDKSSTIKHLRSQVKDLRLLKIVEKCAEDDNEWDKVVFSWFLQLCHELLMMGFMKEKTRGDHFEKNFWKDL